MSSLLPLLLLGLVLLHVGMAYLATLLLRRLAAREVDNGAFVTRRPALSPGAVISVAQFVAGTVSGLILFVPDWGVDFPLILFGGGALLVATGVVMLNQMSKIGRDAYVRTVANGTGCDEGQARGMLRLKYPRFMKP